MAIALQRTAGIFAVAFSTSCCVLGKVDGLRFESQLRERSTCYENHCINPVFPAFEELTRNQDHQNNWQCHPAAVARVHAKFCEAALNYDVAVPTGNQSNMTDSVLARLIGDQDSSAAASYFYHLSGMQLDAWEHQHPEVGDDECVSAVWRMACHTFFPRAEAGCAAGGSSAYLRPCKNVCLRYVEACQVQCCDESVQCAPATPGTVTTVDNHGRDVNLVEEMSEAGPYANEAGPSFHCTGGAVRGAGVRVAAATIGAQFMLLLASFPGDAHVHRRGLLASTLLMLSVALQGCDSSSVSGSWEAKPKYLVDFHVKPSGKSDAESTINSCAAGANLAGEPACSGNGKCKEWLAGAGDSELVSFCACSRDWADPECRTRRKSQAKAFKLSLFGGFLGLDSFYLGQNAVGVAKLTTLGGLGAWWAFDVTRIGSAPIRTANYRLAADLEPWVFITYSMLMAAFVGLCVFVVLECHLRRKKATGMNFAAADEALKSLPFPAVGYGTLKPSDPNAKCLASEPPGVPFLPVAPTVPAVERTLVGMPVPEAAKVPEAKAPEAKAPEAKAPTMPTKTPSLTPRAPSLSDQALTAPLSEVGYGTIAALRSNEQMKTYIKRVVEHAGGRIEDEEREEFSSFVSEYSGVDFVRSFRRMSDALRRAPWVIYEKAAAPISATATVGDMAFFLPCVGGEGAVLMNEVGRPAVANIDLILHGLTKDAPIANEDNDEEDEEENEREEEKPVQVLSLAESFKADDAAQRLGLVLPPLDFDESSPKATPEACALESLLQLGDDPIVEPEALDPVITFVIPKSFNGQVGLIPGARPPQSCFVKAIVPGSWADSCGVRVEDEILAVNGISVSELDRTSFHEEMQKRPLNLSIRTQSPPLLDETGDDCPTPGRVRELVELLNQNQASAPSSVHGSRHGSVQSSVQGSPRNSRQGSAAVEPPAAPASL